MKNNSQFQHYKNVIRNLDISKINNSNDIPVSLRMAEAGNLTVNYIPFDYINTNAKIVLVGITPGFTQLKNALIEAQKQIRANADDSTVLQATKKTGAFSGAMRPNLIEMLDYLMINELLNIRSCDELFSTSNHLVHTTSVLRYPVFVDGNNYNGTPNMIKNPLLLKLLIDQFAKEVAILSNAIFIPLGPKVSEGLNLLVKKGILKESNVLDGLPHPSGANAERIAYFLDKKKASQLSAKTDPHKIDLAKKSLIKKIKSIGNLA